MLLFNSKASASRLKTIRRGVVVGPFFPSLRTNRYLGIGRGKRGRDPCFHILVLEVLSRFRFGDCAAKASLNSEFSYSLVPTITRPSTGRVEPLLLSVFQASS